MKLKKRILKKELGAWDYVKENRNYVYIAAAVFLIGTFFGILLQDRLGMLDESLRKLVEQVKDLGLPELIWFILKNNSTSAFLGLIFGLFFGIFPIFTSAINGVILGYVLSKAADSDGIGVFWRLLPHGIFELPAVLIAIGLGIKLGTGFFENYLSFCGKNRFRKFLGLFAVILSVFGVFVLFSVAAAGVGSGNAGGFGVVSFIGSSIFGLVLVWPMLYLLFGDGKLRDRQWKDFVYRLRNSLKVFFYIILPLLVLAAIIEGFLIFFYR